MPQCLDALSSSDRHLLTALFDAGGDMIVAAGYVGMQEPELLAWSDRPDIRRLVKSERRLRHLKREIKLEAIAMDMLETLQELVHTTEDPVEKRRAASTVLRAIIETNRPKPRRRSAPPLRAPSASSGGPPPPCGGGDSPARGRIGGGASALSPREGVAESPSGGRTPGEGAGSAPRPAKLSSVAECNAHIAQTLRDAHERAEAERREEDENPLSAPSLAKIDANEPAPIPERFYANPRDLLERVADRISLLPNPTGRRAYLAIYGAIQLEIRKNPRTWDPFKEALEQSPLCTLAGENGIDWTRTIDVSDIDESAEIHTASATITWTHANGATKRAHLRLAREPHLGAGDYRWCITDLKTDTS